MNLIIILIGILLSNTLTAVVSIIVFHHLLSKHLIKTIAERLNDDSHKHLSCDDFKFLLSLIPDTLKSDIPVGLDPTMYHTLSVEGDTKIKKRLEELSKQYDIILSR
jgi:hypothetical protein